VREAITSAEALLREIATELVSLPMDERARGLHVRVLGLKRTVSAWSSSESDPPPRVDVETTLTTLRALHDEVYAVRSTSEVRLRTREPTTSRASYFPAARDRAAKWK
jgi:hypothetical protein